MKVTIYVEGGGENNNALRTKCREGFSGFFQKAGLEGHMPKVVACGSRNDAYNRFCIAIRQAASAEFIVLLVDSEAPVEVGGNPWQHLKVRDNWGMPEGVTVEQSHLMVECMENWLLADPKCLIQYYGDKFNSKALSANPNIEEIPKKDVIHSLQEATKNTQKGSYSKGKHSFDLLARIDPAKVVNKAPHAKKLIVVLRDRAINQK